MNITTNKFQNKFLLNFASILFCLLPPALISGPFLSDLFVSLIAIIFLFITFKFRLYFYYQKNFFYLAMFLYLAMLLSSLLSDDISYSLKNSFFYFRFILFTLCIAFLLENNKSLIKYFAYSLFITIFLLLVDSYVQYITDYNILQWERSSRLTSLFGDKAILGTYISKMIILSFALFYMLEDINTPKMIIALIFLVLAEIIVFLSGDRSALFLLTVSTVTIICLVQKLKYLRLLSFIIALIVVTTITYFDQNIKKRVIDNTSQQIGLTDDSEKVNYFSSTHEQIALTAFNQFKDSPLFGHGLKSFRVKCSDPKYIVGNGCSTHPHNTYLQLLAEVGLVGALPVLTIFVFVSIKLFSHALSILRQQKNKVLQDYEICLYTLFFINLFPFIPTLSFFNNWNSIMIYLPVCFILANINVNTNPIGKK